MEAALRSGLDWSAIALVPPHILYGTLGSRGDLAFRTMNRVPREHRTSLSRDSAAENRRRSCRWPLAVDQSTSYNLDTVLPIGPCPKLQHVFTMAGGKIFECITGEVSRCESFAIGGTPHC